MMIEKLHTVALQWWMEVQGVLRTSRRLAHDFLKRSTKRQNQI
jgi:hypothetical protein